MLWAGWAYFRAINFIILNIGAVFPLQVASPSFSLGLAFEMHSGANVSHDISDQRLPLLPSCLNWCRSKTARLDVGFLTHHQKSLWTCNNSGTGNRIMQSLACLNRTRRDQIFGKAALNRHNLLQDSHFGSEKTFIVSFRQTCVRVWFGRILAKQKNRLSVHNYRTACITYCAFHLNTFVDMIASRVYKVFSVFSVFSFFFWRSHDTNTRPNRRDLQRRSGQLMLLQFKTCTSHLSDCTGDTDQVFDGPVSKHSKAVRG